MATNQKLVRADSAHYGHAAVGAARAGGADVFVAVRMDSAVKKAIASIEEDACTRIQYTDAVYAETTSTWISSPEVAEVDFVVCTSKEKPQRVDDRLGVRRIRFHAFSTTSSLDTVAAGKTRRAML